MASKKYSFLAGIFCLLASYGFAQTTGTTGTGTGGYDVADSSVVPSRRMPQHTEFMQGTYNYPAKPKSMWEVGIKGGLFNVIGDVSSVASYGLGAHIRKALGHVVSLRLEYVYGKGKGLNWERSVNYNNNIAWADRYRENIDPVFYNYRTEIHDLSLEALIAFNNINFYRASSNLSLYGIVGLGGMIYHTNVNAVNDGGNAANVFAPTYATAFAGIPSGTWKTRKDTRDAIRDVLDDTYETAAERHGTNKAQLFGSTFRPVGQLGLGVAFKFTNRVNLAIEDRVSFPSDDLLDGQRWAEQVNAAPVMTRNNDIYNFLSVGLNYNIGRNSVQPLWWLNPLDYAYQEIRKPRLMILPKPVLPDADGDGVTDQFDQEQTPQGCPVDTHGVSRDTDGDGVPDCRDKELITPTTCQPVDADGVGKCPVICPDSTCGDWIRPNACESALGSLPSVTFGNNSVSLTEDARTLLTSVATALRNNPNCRVVVIGYVCESSKAAQQRSWDRVNTVINHLVEREGISQDRFIFRHGQEGGDCNTVDLRAAASDEQGQATVPAPHPNLRRSK
jgi:outer membrane protein OmpA-like peptidoglycan-associated protein